MGLLQHWHRIRHKYFLLLADSCLDDELRNKLLSKAEAHKRKEDAAKQKHHIPPKKDEDSTRDKTEPTDSLKLISRHKTG